MYAHVIRVCTPAGEVWEPHCQLIRSPRLAFAVARMLGDFLAGGEAAQRGAPPWAVELRAAIAADGENPSRCRVEVVVRPACRPRPRRRAKL